MMDELERSAFWWTNVPGPHSALVSAADALSASRSVVLKAPAELSWSATMRGVLEESFKSRTGAYDVSVTRVSAADCPPGTDPGRFLLGRYASPADVKRYRPGGRVTVQDFLRTNGILTNRLVWIYGLDANSAENWLRFVRGYNARGPQDGLFVLEGTSEIPDADSQRVETVDLGARISRDDVQLFTHFVLGTDSAQGAGWADYTAAVTSRVCGTDAWLAARIAEDPAFRVLGVLKVLTDLATSEEYAGHGTARDHPFTLIRNGETDAIMHSVWEAQVQVLFPIIELERMSIVDAWDDSIQRALGQDPVERFGVRITEAGDAELGALVYMMAHRIGPAEYQLYLPSEEVRERISFLHDCRNRLAHTDVCSPDAVSLLLDRTPASTC